MKRIGVIAIAGLLLGYGISRAQHTYAVYGQGNQSCGKWTQQNKEVRDTHLFTWVVGFVSGAGFTGTQMRNTDADGIGTWIDTYCAAHPLDSVSKAAGKLVTELERPQ